jgi:hypothetical protein
MYAAPSNLHFVRAVRATACTKRLLTNAIPAGRLMVLPAEGYQPRKSHRLVQPV